MSRDVHLEWSPSREPADGLLGRCTQAVLDLPPPAGYALPPVGARHVKAGSTQQITVLGTRPTGRLECEGAV
ncbi:hypothetical protein OG828_44860 [Streptomyces sp. NBC_00457]|uniref:hypothetical protein n=1 Tax=Streptomyces sp. NBC_00457 TaxID=2975748 RepID=UPI002E1A5FFC